MEIPEPVRSVAAHLVVGRVDEFHADTAVADVVADDAVFRGVGEDQVPRMGHFVVLDEIAMAVPDADGIATNADITVGE